MRCRCATRSPCCSSSRSGCCSTRWRCSTRRGCLPARSRSCSLSARWRRSCSCGRCGSRSRRASPWRSRSRRLASSPSSCRDSAARWDCSRRGHQHDHRHLDRLDCPQPAAVPHHRADHASGSTRHPALVALARPVAVDRHGRVARGAAQRKPRASRGVDRLRSDRTHRGADAEGERHRADGDRDSTSTRCASCASTGADVVYGDATRPETLAEAGTATAGNLILTSAGMANSEEVIRAARDAEPTHPCARARASTCATCPASNAPARRHRVHRRGRGRARVRRGNARAVGRHGRTGRSRARPRPRRSCSATAPVRELSG